MLDKIKYNGFEVSSSQFIEHKDSDGGRYKVSINECEFSSDYDEESGKAWAQMCIEASVKGYEEGALDNPDEPNEDGLAFEVNLKFYIFFDINGNEPLTEESFEENAWFFENFMAITLKLAIESVLVHTPMDSIRIPWSVPTESFKIKDN
ncbi:hypothetical protein ACLE0V_000035 [Cronobacter sakazakii]